MLPPPSPWPFERPEQLADALREQGAGPDEVADLLPAMRRLSEWQTPSASPADTQRLLAWLGSQVPIVSPVRQAIRARHLRPAGRVSWLLATARTQVSIFGPAFWLVSALVTLIGAVAVLSDWSSTPSDQEMLLRASGPFLAYVGTVVAFRGVRARVLEFELVCPQSPLQLALARLVIVLGYDVSLGLALSVALWVGGSAQVFALTLSWFMPLLLVAGLALALSLRLPIQAAATVSYMTWLAILASRPTIGLQLVPFTSLANALLGGIGLALLCVALGRMHADLSHLLPSS